MYSYSVHPFGVKWLEKRLDLFDQLEGPQGVSVVEFEKRLAEIRLEFKRALAEEYMSHWPGFDYTKLLPPEPSKDHLKIALKVNHSIIPSYYFLTRNMA